MSTSTLKLSNGTHRAGPSGVCVFPASHLCFLSLYQEYHIVTGALASTRTSIDPRMTMSRMAGVENTCLLELHDLRAHGWSRPKKCYSRMTWLILHIVRYTANHFTYDKSDRTSYVLVKAYMRRQIFV